MCSAFQVEREFLAGGMVPSDHLMIHTGSLLQADGAFLILDTRDILAEPGAWKGLVRTLRIGRLALLSFYPGVPHPLVPQPAAIPRAITEPPRTQAARRRGQGFLHARTMPQAQRPTHFAREAGELQRVVRRARLT